MVRNHLPTEHKLIFVSERRLGFGTHGASNIAQRFSDALLSLFRKDMDDAEQPLFAAASEPLSSWLATRQKVADLIRCDGDEESTEI